MVPVWGPSSSSPSRARRVNSRGWSCRPWKNFTGPVTRSMSPFRIFRSSQGCPGQAQVIIPVSSWSTAWKILSPDRVGMIPLLRTRPRAVASMPTSNPATGSTVEASSYRLGTW